MAEWEKLYSESSDFSATCDTGLLHTTIADDGTLTSATLLRVDRGRSTGADLDPADVDSIAVVFDVEPSSGDKTKLDTHVSEHPPA